jgi:hypothetical protein
LISGVEENHMATNSSLEEEARPAVKRRTDIVDDDSDFCPMKLNVPLHVDNISGAVLDGVLAGDIDQGLDDLGNFNIDVYGGGSELFSDDPTLISRLDTEVSPAKDASTVLPISTHGSPVLFVTIHFLLHFPFYMFIYFDDFQVLETLLLVTGKCQPKPQRLSWTFRCWQKLYWRALS